MDRTGQTLLGKYELTRVLGKGGMGEVWEGEHTLTGRKVAVKILAENYLTNKKVVARFGREARAASSVNHPGIVEILDQDKTDDGVPFLVMEFLEGESVGERIRKLGKLTQDEALAIMLPLLDALDHAHQAGIIHRDLKPDNVFILPGARGEERIKILDFGISQKADEIEHHLTQEGSVLGTPHYMSPEQARGEPGIDARVDVYAAGVMFYECVVGDVPFDAGNYNALLQIILGTPPPSPRSRGADISPALEQVLLASMEKKRDRRPPSARVFHDLLLEASVQEDDALLDQTSWTFNTPSEPPPPIDFGPEEGGFDMESPPAVDSLAPDKPRPERHTPGSSARGAQAPSRAHSLAFSEPPPSKSHSLAFSEPPPSKSHSLAFSAPPKAAPPPFEEADDLEADIFDRQQRAAAPRPATPGPFAAPSLRPPGAGPAAPNPFDGAARPPSPFGPPPQTRPAGEAARSPFDPAPRMHSQRPPGERPKINFTSQLEDKEHGIGRTIGSWVAALVALALLGYLASIVFTRPDPRKKRQQEAAQAQDGEGTEGASDTAGDQPAEGEAPN